MMGKLKAESFVGGEGIVSARPRSGFTIHAEVVVQLLFVLLQVCYELHPLNFFLSFVQQSRVGCARAQVFRLAEVNEGFIQKLFITKLDSARVKFM